MPTLNRTSRHFPHGKSSLSRVELGLVSTATGLPVHDRPCPGGCICRSSSQLYITDGRIRICRSIRVIGRVVARPQFPCTAWVVFARILRASRSTRRYDSRFNGHSKPEGFVDASRSYDDFRGGFGPYSRSREAVARPAQPDRIAAGSGSGPGRARKPGSECHGRPPSTGWEPARF